MKKSLYIHIPFCRRKCPYCDFYSIVYRTDIAAAYVKTLCRQVSGLSMRFSSMYLGGGTPTVLEDALFEQLLKSLGSKIASGGEFTLEANPDSLSRDKLKLFLDHGGNRLSLGLEALSSDKLKRLGRIHSPSEGINSLLLAEKEGVKNISADLIYGVYPESLNDWQSELREAVNLPLNHLSVYALTYEQKTPFFKALEKGELKSPAEKILAEMYGFSRSYLPKKGFKHYEVSNFAKAGFSCRHNLNYWQNESYIGLGPSAVSFLEGVRSKNSPDVNNYIARVERGQSPVVFRERLSKVRRAKETAALKIRTASGIGFRWFKARTGFDFAGLEGSVLAELFREKLLKYRQSGGKNSGIYLTSRGFLFADTVSAAFL